MAEWILKKERISTKSEKVSCLTSHKSGYKLNTYKPKISTDYQDKSTCGNEWWLCKHEGKWCKTMVKLKDGLELRGQQLNQTEFVTQG